MDQLLKENVTKGRNSAPDIWQKVFQDLDSMDMFLEVVNKKFSDLESGFKSDRYCTSLNPWVKYQEYPLPEMNQCTYTNFLLGPWSPESCKKILNKSYIF